MIKLNGIFFLTLTLSNHSCELKKCLVSPAFCLPWPLLSSLLHLRPAAAKTQHYESRETKAKQGRLNSNLLRRHKVPMHNISDSKLFAAEHRKTAFLLQPSERTSSSSSVLAGLRGTDVLLIRNSVFWWIDMVNVTFIWSDLKSCTGKEDCKIVPVTK